MISLFSLCICGLSISKHTNTHTQYLLDIAEVIRPSAWIHMVYSSKQRLGMDSINPGYVWVTAFAGRCRSAGTELGYQLLRVGAPVGAG